MVTLPVVRAPLFVPANRPERFAKAAASGADAVILDLEDAVADDAKHAARSALEIGFTGLPVMVRVNAHGTPWHDEDIAAMIALRPAAVILPKAEKVPVVAAIAATMGDMPLIALIESARGLANARALAAIDGVVRLAFGSIDYCADLGCDHLREVLLPARSELVLASRLAGISPPLDGVTAQIDDEELCSSDARHARALGMMGKLCIHPRQLSAVKKAFAPSEREIEWARRVLAASSGAVSVDGAMVDEPVRIRARAVLDAPDRA